MTTATNAPMAASQGSVGELLRGWRERQRLSQLALALAAAVSPRHISFLETGRARPRREMLLRLAEHLDIPLRQRNTLLTAAGFAPVYPRRGLDDPRRGWRARPSTSCWLGTSPIRPTPSTGIGTSSPRTTLPGRS